MLRTAVFHPIDEYIGQRIRDLRKRRGLNQQKLAALIDVTFQQVQKYESGANRIHIAKLFEIAVKLEVDIGYFYDGYDDGALLTAGPDAVLSVDDFLMTTEGRELARCFSRIAHAKLRRKVVELTKAYLEIEAQDDDHPSD